MSSLRFSPQPASCLEGAVYWSSAAPTLAKVRILIHMVKNCCGHSLANLMSALRGYLTKYDCSSADINPIGSIDKADLKRFIAWAKVNFEIPCLEDFLTAVPTAELEPVTEDYVQSDEADMGMTYDELTTFGRLRKERKMGPLSMWQHLLHVWGKDREKGPDDTGPSLEPAEIAYKVKFFFAQ